MCSRHRQYLKFRNFTLSFDTILQRIVYLSACRTCSTIVFPYSTNQIIVFWCRHVAVAVPLVPCLSFLITTPRGLVGIISRASHHYHHYMRIAFQSMSTWLAGFPRVLLFLVLLFVCFAVIVKCIIIKISQCFFCFVAGKMIMVSQTTLCVSVCYQFMY